jgi:hypothetical protein
MDLSRSGVFERRINSHASGGKFAKDIFDGGIFSIPFLSKISDATLPAEELFIQEYWAIPIEIVTVPQVSALRCYSKSCDTLSSSLVSDSNYTYFQNSTLLC